MNSHNRAPRGEVSGWTDGATRRNTRFLYSIREHELDGNGFAITLTVRDCPPSAAEWTRMRNAWIHRMKRAGMIRLHWVTEWQRRGVPHLHCAIWFPPDQQATVLSAWIDIAKQYGATDRGQHGRVIDGPVGWFQYLSKHAARGAKHYQRSSANLPEAWQKKTGRMWGHWGDWPAREAIRLELELDGFHALRRLVRAWRLADARASGDVYRIRSARSMLTSNSPTQSAVRGVSEWVPEAIQDAFLANLATRGFSVTC